MTEMSLAANRPINWNLIALNLSPKQMEGMENRLSATDYARARGAEVLALTVPCAIQSRLCLESGFTLDMLNGWAKPMALPVDEKMALLADPSTRRGSTSSPRARARCAAWPSGTSTRSARSSATRTRTTRAARSARSPRPRVVRPSTCCATSWWPTA